MHACASRDEDVAPGSSWSLNSVRAPSNASAGAVLTGARRAWRKWRVATDERRACERGGAGEEGAPGVGATAHAWRACAHGLSADGRRNTSIEARSAPHRVAQPPRLKRRSCDEALRRPTVLEGRLTPPLLACLVYIGKTTVHTGPGRGPTAQGKGPHHPDREERPPGRTHTSVKP